MRTTTKKKASSAAPPKTEAIGSSKPPNPKSKSRSRPRRDETPRERLAQRYADVCVPFPPEPPLAGDDLTAFAPLNTEVINAVLSPLSMGPACALLFNSGTMSSWRISELHAAAVGVASAMSGQQSMSIEYGPGVLDASARLVATQPALATKLHALLACWAQSLHRPSLDLARWDHGTLPTTRRHAAKLNELLVGRAKATGKKEWLRGMFPWAAGANLAGLGTVLSLSWGETGWQRGENHYDGHYTAITITGGEADLYVKGVNHVIRLTPGDVVLLHASEYEYKVVCVGESQGPRFVYTCYTDKVSPETVRQWDAQKREQKKEQRAMTKAFEGVGFGDREGVEGRGGGGKGDEDVTM